MTYEKWDKKIEDDDDFIEASTNVIPFFRRKLKQKMDYLSTDYTKSEIAGFVTLEKVEQLTDGNLRLVLDDILIPPQEASTGEVDIDGKSQVEMFKEYGAEKCQRIIGHWHSHHTMGTFFSQTDETMMKSYSENKSFCIFIVSSEGKHLIRMVFRNKPYEFKIENVEYEVEEDEAIKSEMEEEIKKKVKEPVVTSTTTSFTYRNSPNSELKNLKNDIASRVRYYQHDNHKVKIVSIYKKFADMVFEEFKILNPQIQSDIDGKHYTLTVELGNKSKAKEFMIDVKEFLIKAILLDNEKKEMTTTATEEELEGYLDELEEEEMLQMEREGYADTYSGRCDFKNYKDRYISEEMEKDFDRCYGCD